MKYDNRITHSIVFEASFSVGYVVAKVVRVVA